MPFSSIFQFHKGTIKTKSVGGYYIRHGRFQFHKGTIKTGGARYAVPLFAYFNSIKVQLKLTKAEKSMKRIFISIP